MAQKRKISNSLSYEFSLEETHERHNVLRAEFILQVFPGCRLRPSEKLRLENNERKDLSFLIFKKNKIVASIQLWSIDAGERKGVPIPALLLGPLVVDQLFREKGLGSYLVNHVLFLARKKNIGAIFLVGDPAYYCRFGFSLQRAKTFFIDSLEDSKNLQVLELKKDWLTGGKGFLLAKKN